MRCLKYCNYLAPDLSYSERPACLKDGGSFLVVNSYEILLDCNEYDTKPSANLGSNQVDFGGIN